MSQHPAVHTVTWGEFLQAVRDWGVTDDDPLVGIRLRADGGRVGIRRGPRGIEIVNTGELWSPEKDHA